MVKKSCHFLWFCLLVTLITVTLPPNSSSLITEFPNSLIGIVQAENSALNTTEIAQDPTITPEQTAQNDNGVPVVLDGENVFILNSKGISNTIKDRAEIVSKRIEEIARDPSISLDSLGILEYKGTGIISADSQLVLLVFEEDAKFHQKTTRELTEEYLAKIKTAITQYREKRTFQRIISGIVKSLVLTVLLVAIFGIGNKIFPKIYDLIERWRRLNVKGIRIQKLEFLSSEQIAGIIRGVIRFTQVISILIILSVYISTIFKFFPLTEKLGTAYFYIIGDTIKKTGAAIVDYFPNTFFIIITILTTYYIIRFCRLVFNAIASERLSIKGFYPEWTEPTYKLTVFFIIALAAVLIFPYLPGSQSPAFRGVSIFLGALFTLGGASTIANIVGGFVVIYTRAFRIGDRVKLGDLMGIILEKTILSTRIQTPNNEIVTIPNATIVASNIINYTTTVRDMDQPLIVATTITLGYDLPWRKVHQALIQAALATPGILEDPAPRVWQTGLNDFYIAYEIRAYTKETLIIGEIYSELHQNIQDKCNEADIEILSPHYAALRDGNGSTIPANYLPSDYHAPGFRLEKRSPLNY